MDSSTAERWVVISALVVAGVYGYRRLVEPVESGNIKNIVGIGNPVPLGQFATAWGFAYLVIAIMASANPGLGGSFAILVMAGDLLTNTPSITKDVAKGSGTTATSSSTTSTTTTTATPAQQVAAAPGLRAANNAANAAVKGAAF